MVEFAQFERRELGLGRAAASEDVNLDGLVVLETLVDVRGDFGRQQFVTGLGENAGDVERNVAHAEDGDLLGLERPRTRHVGVAVVPGDEVGRAIAAVEFDTRDAERAVGVGAGGEDDRVVERLQVVEGDVGAVVDVAEQAYLRLVEHLVQGGDDALDARMIRRDAVTNQAEGRGHALEEVDADAAAGDCGVGFHEGVGGVDAGRAGADDRDPEWAVGVSHREDSYLLRSSDNISTSIQFSRT